MSTPILFLDFDGVIRVAAGMDGTHPQWRGKKIKALAGLCEQAGARIVVISHLRLTMRAADILGCVGLRLGGLFHKIWATAPSAFGIRAQDVEQWLCDHGEGVNHFAIIDDEARHYDGAPIEIRDRLILCNSRFGFQPEKQGRQLLKLLGCEPSSCDQGELELE